MKVHNGTILENLPKQLPLCFFILIKAEAGEISKSYNLKVSIISPSQDQFLNLLEMSDFSLKSERNEIRLMGEMLFIQFGSYTLRISIDNKVLYNEAIYTVSKIQQPAALPQSSI